jgi:hypothetical protein
LWQIVKCSEIYIIFSFKKNIIYIIFSFKNNIMLLFLTKITDDYIRVSISIIAIF